jgi:hypothetical protein
VYKRQGKNQPKNLESKLKPNQSCDCQSAIQISNTANSPKPLAQQALSSPQALFLAEN